MWSSAIYLESGSNLGSHFSGFLGKGCWGPSMAIASWSSHGLAGLFGLAIGVGGVEGWYEELPLSEDSSLEEEGDEGGGDGGIPDPPAAGVRIGSVGFKVRSVPPSCSLISDKSSGWFRGQFGCLIWAKALCVLMRDWWTISCMSPPVGFGVTGSTVIRRSWFDVVVIWGKMLSYEWLLVTIGEWVGGGGFLRPPRAINSFQAFLLAPFVDGWNWPLVNWRSESGPGLSN